MRNARVFWYLLISIFVVGNVGCGGEKAFQQLSSPEQTVKTYMDGASSLRSSVDITAYREAISCFSKEDREWFENNHLSLPFDTSDPTYGMLRKLQKKAYIFGETVAKAGPTYARTISSEKTGDEAVVTVDGYSQPIKLIKEGPNWLIVGLFGIEQ